MNHRMPMPFSAPGEPSILDTTTARDNLRWALSALELVTNGLRNRRNLDENDPEMRNLKCARESVIDALTIIRKEASK